MISSDKISCDKLCDITHSIQENITVEPTITTKYHSGITCCVPLCYNISLKNLFIIKNLSFCLIPKESNLRKKSLISRKNFIPSISDWACSVHFTGGKKT